MFKKPEVTSLKLPEVTCLKSRIDILEKCEICSRIATKTPDRRHWRRVGVFIVKSEISYLFPVIVLLTLTWQMLKKTLRSLFMDGV